MNKPAVIWVDLEEDKCSPMETEWHTVKYIEASVVEDLLAAERAKSAKLVSALEYYADGEGDVLDWSRVNHPSCIQDRGEHARAALAEYGREMADIPSSKTEVK